MTTTIPVAEIDAQLADLYEQADKLGATIRIRLNTAHTMVGDVKRRQEPYGLSDDEAIAKLRELGAENTYSSERANEILAELPVLRRELDRVEAQKLILNKLWIDSPWTRAYLVTSSDGHVHRSTSCSTCTPKTTYAWLPEYSGRDEDEIIAAAGERACTVCYPSAPVEVLSRPTKIFTEDERRRQAAREERDAKRAERDAKKARNAMPLGLRDCFDWKLETLTAAKQALTDCYDHPYARQQDPKYRQELAAAIAAKLNENARLDGTPETTAAEQVELAKKRAAKRR